MSTPLLLPQLSCTCGTEEYDDAGIITDTDALCSDLTYELKAYAVLQEELWHMQVSEDYKSSYPATEDFSFSSISDMVETLREHKLEALGYVTGRILSKCFNAILSTLNFVTNSVVNYGLTYSAAAKIWDTYLKMRLRAIDKELLESVQEEIFPYEFFHKAFDTSMHAFQFCLQVETVCTDTSSAALTTSMKCIAKELETIGIVPSLSKGKVSMDAFVDERRFGDLATLGYDTAILPNITRYCKDLSTVILDVTKSKVSPVQLKYDAFAQRISAEVLSINESVEDGTLDKNSKEYRTRMERLMLFTSRLAYCTQILAASCTIAEICATDLKNMFYRIHVALTKIA